MILIKSIIWISGCMFGLKLYEWFELLRGTEISTLATNIYRWLGKILLLVFVVTSFQGYQLIFSSGTIKTGLRFATGLSTIFILPFLALLALYHWFFDNKISAKGIIVSVIYAVAGSFAGVGLLVVIFQTLM